MNGLLLVGHGTREDAGVSEFLSLAGLVAALLPEVAIEPCFLELAEPAIAAGVARLRARGIERLTVVPVLLFSAGHAQRDIPAAVAAAIAGENLALRGPVRQAGELGCHRRIVELSALRFRETLRGADDAKSTVLVMVGRGSHDEEATRQMQRFVELRRQATPVAEALLGFVAMAEPKIDDVLRQVAATTLTRDVSEGGQRIVVQPHLLFSGQLLRDLRAQVVELQAAQPRREWVVAEPLGPHPWVADALVERYRQAIERI